MHIPKEFAKYQQQITFITTHKIDDKVEKGLLDTFYISRVMSFHYFEAVVDEP